MMKRWKHKTPHLRRKTKSEASFVFKLMMCSSSMNNVILCLFLVVFILCFVEQCVLWCYVLYSVFYVMFVILMFVFNFNVFVHHCSRIFRSYQIKKKKKSHTAMQDLHTAVRHVKSENKNFISFGTFIIFQ